jgi:hypothetical protein
LTLLTIAAIAFLSLHILASAILPRAPAVAAMEHPELAISSLYD